VQRLIPFALQEVVQNPFGKPANEGAQMLFSPHNFKEELTYSSLIENIFVSIWAVSQGDPAIPESTVIH
jgi:hypothetical protein